MAISGSSLTRRAALAGLAATALTCRSSGLRSDGAARAQGSPAGGRVAVDDYVEATAGERDESSGFQRALNEARARGAVLYGRRGAVYRLDRGVGLPDGTTFAGEGCTIRSARHDTIFRQRGRASIYATTFEGPGGYDGRGMAISCRGGDESRGAGMAPRYLEGCVYEGLSFRGIGHTALDLAYLRGVRVRDIAVADIGYAGIMAFSVDDFDGVGFTGDTFLGETESGTLNAYAIAFTSAVGTRDFDRDPPSRRCSYRSGTIRNLPTWHALDTHGGHDIAFSDFELIDVRRAVAITNRVTASARNCTLSNIRSVNRLPFDPRDSFNRRAVRPSFNANGVLKRDSGIWVIGASTADPATGIRLDNVQLQGHGRPGQIDGAFWLENSDARLSGCGDEDSWTHGIFVPGGFTGAIAGHRCVNPISFAGADNAVVRALESRGGVYSAEIDYVRSRPLPAGVGECDAVVRGAGPGHRPTLVATRNWGRDAARLRISGDARFVQSR